MIGKHPSTRLRAEPRGGGRGTGRRRSRGAAEAAPRHLSRLSAGAGDADAGRGAGQERGLHQLPHRDQFADDAHERRRQSRLRRLPWRRRQRDARAPWSRRAATQYRALEDKAHVQPRYPEAWNWPSSAKPEDSYTLLNHEAPEFIRFVNPSDYRVAREACGACHLGIIQAAERSLMATAAHFWAAASYNNGIVPFKHAILGEAYTRDGQPASRASRR